MLILNDHDHAYPPLGAIRLKNDRLYIQLKKPVSKEQFFSIFGNVGFFVTKGTDDYIQEAEILEFSLSP